MEIGILHRKNNNFNDLQEQTTQNINPKYQKNLTLQINTEDKIIIGGNILVVLFFSNHKAAELPTGDLAFASKECLVKEIPFMVEKGQISPPIPPSIPICPQPISPRSGLLDLPLQESRNLTLSLSNKHPPARLLEFKTALA